ncbi:MAG: 50S ribosomal protein L28 [Candidatus Hydrogenedentes bacterium]|nr:50S ribosomal protein L28 [Candidatus Hydrogenedentota bacterium]
MARKCDICGRGPRVGNNVVRRGKPKKEGGIGLNVTGISKRRFLPNIQNVRVLHNGSVRRMKVCTRCLKKGKVVKAG